MKTKLIFMIGALSIFLSTPLFSKDQGFDSWSEWLQPVIGNVTPKEIDEFRSHLSSGSRKFFNSIGEGSRALSVLIYRGLKTANENSRVDLYEEALKIANKAEVGFYMDKASRRLDYAKYYQ